MAWYIDRSTWQGPFKGWLVGYHPTVAHWVVCIFVCILFQNVLVVALDDTFHVFGAAVADLDSVTVEDFIEPVMLWKMLVNEL